MMIVAYNRLALFKSSLSRLKQRNKPTTKTQNEEEEARENGDEKKSH